MKVYGYASVTVTLLLASHAWASDPDALPIATPAPDSVAQRLPAEADAAFAAKLKLRPDQKPAYAAWCAAVAPDPASRAADAAQRALALDTGPHFFAFVQAHMTQDLERARRESAATDALYAVLAPEQRAKFDKAVLPQMSDVPVAPAVSADDEMPDVKPNYQLAARSEPDWIQQPTGDTLAVFYPVRAQREHVIGSATVTCTITRQGVAMDCRIASESPEGYGFGNATVEVAGFFRFRPATVYGVPVQSQVTIPLAWRLSEGEDAAESGKPTAAPAPPSKRTP